MTPRHRTSPPLVSKEHFEFLVTILLAVRKKRANGSPEAQNRHDIAKKLATKDTADVLEALRLAGYQVVPKGLIDSFKKTLETLL